MHDFSRTASNAGFWHFFWPVPHLSHDDGENVDLAFYYANENGYLPAKVHSRIGYFAFEEGPTECTGQWPTLRWDVGWLQPLWRDYALEPERNRTLLRVLSADDRVGKILLEPHLVDMLDVAHPKIRFQGCRAARHDDHVHLQL